MKKNNNQPNKPTGKKQLASLMKVRSELNPTQAEEARMNVADIKPADLNNVSDGTVQAVMTSLGATAKPRKTGKALQPTKLITIPKPELQILAFEKLRLFVNESGSTYKTELTTLLYPIFVQIYLKLMRGRCIEWALKFLHKYGGLFEENYKEGLQKLVLIRKLKDLDFNPFVTSMDLDKYHVKITKSAFSLLKGYLQECKQLIIADIINKYLKLETYEPKSIFEKGLEGEKASSIAVAGENDNKIRVYYGLLQDIDLEFRDSTPDNSDEDDDTDETVSTGKPKKKRNKKQPKKKNKLDPNSPAVNRIPLPIFEPCPEFLDDQDDAYSVVTEHSAITQYSLITEPDENATNVGNVEKVENTKHVEKFKIVENVANVENVASVEGFKDFETYEEYEKYFNSQCFENVEHIEDPEEPLPEEPSSEEESLEEESPEEELPCQQLSAEELPYTCMYTVLKAKNMVACLKISEDGTLIAIGLTTSNIEVWSLTENELLKMKSVTQLQHVDVEDENVHLHILDKDSGEKKRILMGHMGTITGCSFSPDKLQLVSSSVDHTIRLWSLLMWECVFVYKGHMQAVWDVCFSPHGFYIVSGSADKTARLWNTDEPQSVRVFLGHLSDVDCVQFHPNSNYIATGSSDHSVRLFDVMNGQTVRLLIGHKNTVYTLEFSVCGRYLLSGGSDCNVIVWDLVNGHLIITLEKHKGTIYSMSFSREGTLLAVGGSDNQLTLWDFSKLIHQYLIKGGPFGYHYEGQLKCQDMLLRQFFAKKTRIICLLFSRQNILLSAGAKNE